MNINANWSFRSSNKLRNPEDGNKSSRNNSRCSKLGSVKSKRLLVRLSASARKPNASPKRLGVSRKMLSDALVR